jgi:hypothetical protein
MHRWLLGRVSFRSLLDAGHVEVHGPAALARDFPSWFDNGFFAAGLRRADERRAGAPVPTFTDVFAAHAAALAVIPGARDGAMAG